MNVTDSSRASSAAALVVGGLAANLGFALLSYLVSWLVPGSYEGPYPLIEEALWLVAIGVLAIGLFQLSSAVDDPTVTRLAAVGLIAHSLVDVVALLLMRTSAFDHGLPNILLSDASMIFACAARCLLLWSLVLLSSKTHAWVVPLLGLVAVLTVLRTGLSLAATHHLVSLTAVYRYVMPLVSLFSGGALVVGALAVKSAVASAPQTQDLVAAAGLRPAAPTPVSPWADFLVGGILLVVGLGVTVVSLEAASNGGRYVVATGAIGVGAGRIIRGLVRLGRGS